MQAQYIQIGEIVKPQGIRGEVKLRAMTSDMSRYARLETVYFIEGGEYLPRKVLKGRANGGFAYLLLEGVTDRNQAEALRGRGVYVDREHAIELSEDENFVCDLVGLTAVSTEGAVIGRLTDVLTPNSVCDVYVFDTPRGEMMMPALRRVVREVDVEAGCIVLDEAALAEVAVWQDEGAERDE
ncbi:MAG: ribosome maturation factor RimM [Clostridia bacterium]|nr:ribosome maturation factor RimM [Clostridia bacterium]